jgi:hypothetical protein
MESTLQPRYFGPPARRLFGVYHPVSGVARAAVLMCPPLLHEHVRSYRFFSQVAGQLAEAGIACLRFDYFGTGDSEAGEEKFSPADTRLDLTLAAEELRRSSSTEQMIVMGIRGSALFAHRDAAEIGASAIWLWQPVTDGAAYLATLRARDSAERNSRFRYPLLKGEAESGPHDLMGFALSEYFGQELAACSINASSPGMPLTTLEPAGITTMMPTADVRLELPLAVTAWADEVDLSGLIPLREARPVVESLISGMARGAVHG